MNVKILRSHVDYVTKLECLSDSEVFYTSASKKDDAYYKSPSLKSI